VINVVLAQASVMTAADRTNDRSVALYWGLFALVIASFLVRQRLHGLAYPPPWPDEGSFLWPALAFRDSGSLLAPELDPTREVLWMPPGYMVWSGAIFKVTGFSLQWARMLSGLYLCGAFACVAAVARRLPARWGYLGLFAVFLHSPIAVLAGNTARMETLVLLVAAVGFLLFERGLRSTGLALLALGPLVHPNGVFPLLGGLAFCLIPFRGNLALLRPQRLELIAIAFSVLCWVVYAVHVANHFPDWLQDSSFQLHYKESQVAAHGGLLTRFLWPGLWMPAPVILTTLVEAKGLAAGGRQCVAVLCASLWLQTLLTVGWMYEVYSVFMLLLACILAVELSAPWLIRRLDPRRCLRLILPSALAVLAALLSAGLVIRSHFVMRSVKSATMGVWPASPAYMTQQDRAVIARYLHALAAHGGPLIVSFAPGSEALVFHDLRGPSLRFCQQSFHMELADVYIFHDSVWLPRFVRNLDAARMALQNAIPIPIEEWKLLRRRDSTESWRVYRRR
jgi:hypothetical protein